MSDEFPRPSGDAITDRKRMERQNQKAESSFDAPHCSAALDQIDRLIRWLEACEMEERANAAKAEGKAEAFGSAALKARFARQGMP